MGPIHATSSSSLYFSSFRIRQKCVYIIHTKFYIWRKSAHTYHILCVQQKHCVCAWLNLLLCEPSFIIPFYLLVSLYLCCVIKFICTQIVWACTNTPSPFCGGHHQHQHPSILLCVCVHMSKNWICCTIYTYWEYKIQYRTLYVFLIVWFNSKVSLLN